MTRTVLCIAALFLLCNTPAHTAPNTYSSGFNLVPELVPALQLSWEAVEMNTLLQESCTELYNDGFESSFGNWIDGGSNCARSNSFPNSGLWSVELRAGVGLTSAMYTPALNLSGVGVTLSFSFYPVGYENGEGVVLEYATDASGTYTGFTAWVAGNHFQNNTRYNITVSMNSVSWTSTSRLRLRSVASASDDRAYIDDVVISNCCAVGSACNDHNQCTTGDVINSNCQCAGTWQDADSDGTCDAFDVCPGVDDYLIISEAPCDDGDPCTTGDHMDIDVCGCQGQYTDWDQDGYCHVDDPNDFDACIPDPENPACNPCVTYNDFHFESNFGNWNSGGNDCSRLYAPQYASAGNYCVRIRDNSGTTSSLFSNNYNVSAGNHVTISFSYITVGMDANEDFLLEVSTNGGGSYTTFKSWVRGVDFQNNERKFVSIAVTGFTWTAQTRFRFRCDASANDDNVYIDEIIVKVCENFPQANVPGETVLPEFEIDGPNLIHADDVILSPNPAVNKLRLTGISLDHATVDVFNTSGSLVPFERLNENTLDISLLNPGLYFIRIEKEGQVVVKRFVKE